MEYEEWVFEHCADEFHGKDEYVKLIEEQHRYDEYLAYKKKFI